MNWKSTAVVSGAGLLATWLANFPATRDAQEVSAPAAVRVADRAPAPDVARLAVELHRRNETMTTYSPPARNLFRFTPRPTASAAPRVAASALVEAPPVAPAPVLRFSGVATDRVGDTEVWTAILNTPTGLVLAREGDEVTGFTVSAIGAESVTLARPDGSMLTLPLSGK